MNDITLMMERKGYTEETHFAFSYTPIRDETGSVAGIFCPCMEITGQVLAERTSPPRPSDSGDCSNRPPASSRS